MGSPICDVFFHLLILLACLIIVKNESPTGYETWFTHDTGLRLYPLDGWKKVYTTLCATERDFSESCYVIFRSHQKKTANVRFQKELKIMLTCKGHMAKILAATKQESLGKLEHDHGISYFGIKAELVRTHETTCGGRLLCVCRKTNRYYEMDCTNRSISTFPTEIPSNVTKLNFAMNILTIIPGEAFVQVPALKCVLFPNNNITHITEGAFDSNKKITVIDLSHNKLVHLPEKLFWKTTKLEILKLARNMLKSLPADLLLQARELKEIQLSGNNIQEIPHSVFVNQRKLRTIGLSGNNIQQIPHSVFANQKKLLTIELSNNYIRQFPSGVFATLTTVKKLRLFRNRIYSCDVDTFSSNTNATSLDISRNIIKELPRGIFDKNIILNILDISFNMLRFLPRDLIFNCPSLRSLHLGSNQLSSIPRGFFQSTPNITFLTLSNNRFLSLTKESLIGLGSLRYFTLSGNQLPSLPRDIFRDIQFTGYVDISNNQLSNIPDGIWHTNRKDHTMEYLLLQENNLTELNNKSFEGLNTIKRIFLNNNFIRSIGPNTFRNTSVQFVYLFSNNLTEVTNNSFGQTNLKEIHLYKNNITNLSENALRGIRKSNLYLTCNKLNSLPWCELRVNGTCVHNDFVPSVKFNGADQVTSTFFKKQGFMCKSDHKYVTCRPCSPGMFADGLGNCVKCPKGGFYQDEIGSKTCKWCSNGNFVQSGGGSLAIHCETCPEGTKHSEHAGYRACFCKDNYSRVNRFGECKVCTLEGVNCSHDFQTLLPGYYWNWSFPETNLSEYSKFVNNLLIANDSYDLLTSKYTQRIPNVLRCPRIENCLNRKYNYTPHGIQGTCLKGHRGWLCSKCQDNFYSVLRYCVQCQSKLWIIFEMAVTVAIFLLLVIFVIWYNRRARHREKRLFVDKLSSRMKIFLGFYQVVGELYESVNVVSLVGPLRYVGELITFVSLNFLKVIIRPQCINSNWLIDPILRFNIALFLPMGIILLPTTIFVVCKLCVKYVKRGEIEGISTLRNTKSKLLTYVLLVLFIIYQPICDAIFEVYPGACDTFEVLPDSNMTISLLRADYDIDCSRIAHHQTKAYIFTVLYVFAFPLSLFIALWKYCSPSSIGIEGDNTRAILNDGFHGNEETPLINTDRSYNQTFPLCLKFLCENYKPRFWYWEILEMARKVCQTMMITLLGWEDALTKLFTISASVLFLTLHVKFSPMKSKFEQHLQLFSLTAIFINVLVAAVSLPDKYQSSITTLLMILDVGIVLAVAGEVFLVLLRSIRRKVGLMHFQRGRSILTRPKGK